MTKEMEKKTIGGGWDPAQLGWLAEIRIEILSAWSWKKNIFRLQKREYVNKEKAPERNQSSLETFVLSM